MEQILKGTKGEREREGEGNEERKGVNGTNMDKREKGTKKGRI